MAADVESIDDLGPKLSAVKSTLRMNPSFLPAVVQFLRQQTAISDAATAQMSQQMHQSRMAHLRQQGQAQQQIYQTQQETSDIIAQTYQDRSASMDRMQEMTSQVIRDVEVWNYPSGDRVELPLGFETAATDGMGNYVVSDDPSFNVNEHSYKWWTALEKE